MSNHTIILPEQTYKVLLEVARQQGITPENWIAAQLSKERVLPNTTPTPEPLLSELTGDLIGAIDSQAVAMESPSRLSMTEISRLPVAERHKILAPYIAGTAEDFLNDPELTEFSVLDGEDWDLEDEES
ncbi:hypothetical protein [Okeania sp.]|uniref:hypothetical protein n=1 Tax=Okeania sp. TaxID=3100323 RepID=UPI002B4B3665|nr:hypothetical protein [Okeania sp.]MEB3340737.1 hypothetical protein [Okeania sp.]